MNKLQLSTTPQVIAALGRARIAGVDDARETVEFRFLAKRARWAPLGDGCSVEGREP